MSDTPETDKHRSMLRTIAESTAFEEKLERERDKWRGRFADADVLATNNTCRRQWHGPEMGWIPAGMSVIMFETAIIEEAKK
jgi:hypothetical protein